MKAVLDKVIEKVGVYHLHDSTISVKEAVDEVIAKLEFGMPLSFKAIASGADSKLHVVVTFLAILELYKQGFVDIDLSEKLGDMNISLIAKTGEDINVNVDDWGEEISEPVNKIIEEEKV